MIPYSDALTMIRETAIGAEARGEKNYPLEESLRMVLARDILGPEDVPHFDNASMDGFAVRSKDTGAASATNPVELPVRGFLAAGDTRLAKVNFHIAAAIEIMTGAEMPGTPFDAVVKLEDVEVVKQGSEKKIIIRRPVPAGENMRLRGSDFKAGQLVAKAGTWMSAEHMMACASLGIAQITAVRRPKVAILSTGKELVAVGEERTHSAQIWNSSGIYLETWLREMGCKVLNLGIIEDSPESFQIAVARALDKGVDIVLSTGAVSMGKHDFITDAIRSFGAEIFFHKAAIRPGKPICFGKFSRERGCPAFFGLPGNPISTAVGLRFFVEPYLRILLGLDPESGNSAILQQDCPKPSGLRCFYKGKAKFSAEGTTVEALSGQASYMVSSLIEANCWVVLPEDLDFVRAGTSLKIFSLSPAVEKGVWL